MQILLKKPRGGSASQMFVTAGVRTFKALLRHLMYKFMQRLDVSITALLWHFQAPV